MYAYVVGPALCTTHNNMEIKSKLPFPPLHPLLMVFLRTSTSAPPIVIITHLKLFILTGMSRVCAELLLGFFFLLSPISVLYHPLLQIVKEPPSSIHCNEEKGMRRRRRSNSFFPHFLCISPSPNVPLSPPPSSSFLPHFRGDKRGRLR